MKFLALVAATLPCLVQGKAPKNKLADIETAVPDLCVGMCVQMTKHTYDITTKTRKQMCSKTVKQFNNWVDNDFGPCVKNGCPAEHYKSIGADLRKWVEDFCGYWPWIGDF